MSNPLFNIFSFGKSNEKDFDKPTEDETPQSDSESKSASMMHTSAPTSSSSSSSSWSSAASQSSSSTPWWRVAFQMREIRVKDYPDISYSGQSHIALPGPLASITAFSQEELLDRIKGAVFGQCLGDALGVHTEFLSKARSYQLYGDGNVPIGEPIRGWAGGDWTDDTDQMVLILDMLLAHGGLVNEKDFAARLSHWVEYGFSELGDGYGNGCGGVVSAATRNPLFLDDPHAAARQVYEKSGGWAAANGAVMRTSILGVPNFYDLNKVVEQTRRVSTCTHCDPRCTASSILCTAAIALLLQGRLYDPADPSSIEKVISEAFKIASEELRRCGELEIEMNKRKRKELIAKQKEKELKMKENENVQRKTTSQERRKAKKEQKRKKKQKAKDVEDTPAETETKDEQDHEQSDNAFELVEESDEDEDFNVDSDDEFHFMNKSPAVQDLDSDDDLYGLNEDGKREKISERFSRWMREMKSHCSAAKLEDLHLDESRKIGYTLKCIGSGVWSVRQNDFKRSMVQLVLEGGDADTNAAVGGAMLGAKLGYSKLPNEWLKLMPYREWLNKRLDRMLGYMGLAAEPDTSAHNSTASNSSSSSVSTTTSQ